MPCLPGDSFVHEHHKMSTHTILCDRSEHPLQDVVVDHNVHEADGVEVAPEAEGEDGAGEEELHRIGRGTGIHSY